MDCDVARYKLYIVSPDILINCLPACILFKLETKVYDLEWPNNYYWYHYSIYYYSLFLLFLQDMIFVAVALVTVLAVICIILYVFLYAN